MAHCPLGCTDYFRAFALVPQATSCSTYGSSKTNTRGYRHRFHTHRRDQRLYPRRPLPVPFSTSSAFKGHPSPLRLFFVLSWAKPQSLGETPLQDANARYPHWLAINWSSSRLSTTALPLPNLPLVVILSGLLRFCRRPGFTLNCLSIRFRL